MVSLNEEIGLTETYQHDFDDDTRRCKKCHRTVENLVGQLKLCPVIGSEEVANFIDRED